ncbi:hypothetical protein [Actinokineospora sp. NBRC 105648]|uniref:hypothetical protein n=1 Tax=Actinokineospora sp. NBRC 105648 TaxID=3032206 RepID=UPI0024A361BD|nr:hypothetical protein [Actinokineospora sp. NBRC 105648]GLZ42106.1 hypothetical protein Acsp05_57300 [Actinokineospora sp. NBRC 105648]
MPPNRALRLEHEALTALTREAAELRAALDDVIAYAEADDLAAHHFGRLGNTAGAAFTRVRAALRESFERAIPEIETMTAAVAESAHRMVETDEDAARRITQAGHR